MFYYNGKLVVDVVEYEGIFHFYNAGGWVIARVTNEYDNMSRDEQLKRIAQEYGDRGNYER